MKLMAIKTRTTRRGRPEKGRQTEGRSTIIRATEKLLADHEPAELTRLMVARAAGVDPRLIRYYFGTMQNLLAEVVLAGQKDIEKAIADMRSIPKPVERLEMRIRHRTQLFLEHPKYHQLVLGILKETPRSAQGDALVRIFKSSLEDLKEILEIGTSQGKMRDVDPALLHLTILGACEFVANNQDILAILRNRKTTKDDLGSEFVEFFTDLVLRGLLTSDSD
jgi:TetR/AcrR family transcriptional regulator